MKKKVNKSNQPQSEAGKKEKEYPKGYPLYPDSEDIYKKFQEEEEINPENISKTKAPNSSNASRRKDLENVSSENDLDIPGSELDDSQEDIGSEDEENNYYSLGGDRHEDLEEDKDET